jgi:catabolite regulation protein CreA
MRSSVALFALALSAGTQAETIGSVDTVFKLIGPITRSSSRRTTIRR